MLAAAKEKTRAWGLDSTNAAYIGGSSSVNPTWHWASTIYSYKIASDRLDGTYYPYGEERGAGNPPADREKFATYTRDSATGLDYAVNRYYYSVSGRFLSADGFQSSSHVASPGTWNRYSYVLGDPINGMDPDGRLTLLINGSFNSTPDWTDPNGDFGQAVASTFDTAADGPIEAWQWTDNDAVTIVQGYSGIENGADALVAFINSYHFAPGEKLNLVAHSHGGNVVLLAADYLHHKVDNLVTLGMPVNWDLLPSESKGNIQNYCAVSSYTDYVQFSGSSPWQIYQTGLWTYAAEQYQQAAIEAIFRDDWIGYAWNQYQAAKAAIQADLWWSSTKIIGADHNVRLSGYGHADLHMRAVWNQITQPCGLSH